MRVSVKYHGIIADMMERKTETVELPDGATVADLRAALGSQDEMADAILVQTRSFVDGHMVDKTAALSDGVEVVFMRPIAGGSGAQTTTTRRAHAPRVASSIDGLDELIGSSATAGHGPAETDPL
ncbi:MAG: MoaD/ThiS family protein [Chloroflexota bacterium]